MNNYFVIFDHLNLDGSLLKMSPADAYEYALCGTYHTFPKPEGYEQRRERALRAFAKDYLLGVDRARFLSYASVPVKELPYGRDRLPNGVERYPIPEPTDLLLDSDFE